MMPNRLNYLTSSALKRIKSQGNDCPSCGAKSSEVIVRKYIVTSLNRCLECSMLFRTPTTSNSENFEFYQKEYSQGFTTDCPSDDELDRLIQNEFRGTEKDYSTYISVLDALGCQRNETLLDFGCSWGYGTWQLAKAGYQTRAFEVSNPRGRYAKEKLDVNVLGSIEDIEPESVDIFFSAHVLEHVPSVHDTIDLAWKVLKEGGLFVAFTPNGSDDYRQSHPKSWQKLWGSVHPNFLCDRYYVKKFSNNPYLITSLRYPHTTLAEPKQETFKLWRNSQTIDTQLTEMELVVAARKASVSTGNC